MTDLNFEQVVFSGGGTRCFWHGGFLESVQKPLDLRPKRIAAVSGGALSAVAFVARREETLFRVMAGAIEERRSNLSTSFEEIQSHGLTPHQQMYRDVVEQVLDADACAAVADGPEMHVLLAHPPTRHLPKWSTFPMMAAYLVDLAVRSTPHVTMPARLGARQELVDARAAARDGKLVDLICNAAVIPPVFNLQGWNGRPVIDGGMTSKAPMPPDDAGNTLVLLTRRFRNMPEHPQRLYVPPSQDVPADKIDFTDRDKIEATWRQGREDGIAFLQRHGLGERQYTAA